MDNVASALKKQGLFCVSAGLAVLFVGLGAIFSDPLGSFFETARDMAIETYGWFYILCVALFLIFVLGIGFSRFGGIKLGRDDDRPEFSRASWFAMLFSAGMGIGLLFYSVAEPVLHLIHPRTGDPRTLDAARDALNLTFFHWGLHAWAIYIVVGLSLAYFGFRQGMPLTIRYTLYPLLGNRVTGPAGKAVEVMAVIATMFGVATSLGFGAMQIGAGLERVGVVQSNLTTQLWVVGGVTLVATASVASGLSAGIRRLSFLNLLCCLALLAFVIIFGPTIFLAASFVQSIGYYLQRLPEMTFRTDALHGLDWQKDWTMFFWGWWISWSPFVGMFVARISRGRTIREFVFGVLFVPALLTLLWVVAFGNTALHTELFGEGGLAGSVETNIPAALFTMLDTLPLSWITSTFATLVILLFFVTSADSGAMVMGILTSDGDPDPSLFKRVFWGLVTGGGAAVLLAAGGLAPLQTAGLLTALPFSLIMLAMCVSLWRGLSATHVYAGGPTKRAGNDADQKTNNPSANENDSEKESNRYGRLEI